MVNANPTFLDRQYGVVIGTAKDALIHPVYPSRCEVRLECDAATTFRISFRIASRTDNELKAWFSSELPTVTKFNIPALAASAPGFRPLEVGMQVGEGLDYLRDRSFDINKMQPIAVHPDGVSLANLLGSLIRRAIHTEGARLVVFGQAFRDLKPDRLFHHCPAWGMHDIHMMQGNPPAPHGQANRVYGDGALFAWFPPERQITALFLRFDAQGVITDDHGAPADKMWLPRT